MLRLWYGTPGEAFGSEEALRFGGMRRRCGRPAKDGLITESMASGWPERWEERNDLLRAGAKGDISSHLSPLVSKSLTCARIDSIRKLGHRRETPEEVYREGVVSRNNEDATRRETGGKAAQWHSIGVRNEARDSV